MNILKVFNTEAQAMVAQQDFALDNLSILDCLDKYGKVKLLTGHSIYFHVVNSIEDCHKMAGQCFSWVEYNGEFHKDIKQWISSRIREPSQ